MTEDIEISKDDMKKTVDAYKQKYPSDPMMLVYYSLIEQADEIIKTMPMGKGGPSSEENEFIYPH